jgi:predicted O-linked N-acetylglucosamine transferase (SPINDLY family)
MTAEAHPPHTGSLSIEQMMQDARALHRDGQLFEAGTLYQRVLQAQPAHAEANHNLGRIAVQAQQPEAGLAYLAAALEAEPANGQYWLGYIDALHQAGQGDDARAMLAQARQQGLEGPDVLALAARIGVDVVADAATGRGADRATMEAIVHLFEAGQYEAVATHAGSLTVHYPDDPFGWKILGVALKRLDRDAEAVEPMLKAAALLPDDVEAHYNAAVVLQGQGRADEAEAAYRHALCIDPRYADAHLNLGVLLDAQGRREEAEAALREALRIRPGYAEAHANLGGVLQALDRLDEAAASCRRALELVPDNPMALNSFGIVLQRQGQLDEAAVHFRLALARLPDFAAAHRNLGQTLLAQGEVRAAEQHYRKAIELDACDAGAHVALGDLLRQGGRLNEVEVHYRRAFELRPDDPRTGNALGMLLQEQGRSDEALACHRRALAAAPDSVATLSSLAQAQFSLGQVDEAEASFREALRLRPDIAMLHSNLLHFLTLSRAGEPATVAAHRAFGDRIGTPLRPFWPVHDNPRDPARRIRVGFVSADFFQHAVASFFEPILDYLSGCPDLELHAYFNGRIEDDVTERLRGRFAHWQSVATWSDDALFDAIRADGIDLLVDLSGHTGYNRLPVFARKPAPVQASWIGYPGTTGLAAVDYFLCDRFLLPPGRFDDQFVEKIVRLPGIAPFQPDPAAPPVNALPALENGYVTFGSFNRPNKLNRAVIALWARLLRTLPDARLLLGAMPAGGHETLRGWFETEGIAADRLAFHPRSGMADYLALHHRVDFCLDTFPYNGGTTTHHALWMGVPTLTLAGASMPGRVGVANLLQAGVEGFAVESADAFVERGLAWARNLPALAALRAGLREQLLRHPLRDPLRLSESVRLALRGMWTRHCTGQPVEAFEIELPAEAACKGRT